MTYSTTQAFREVFYKLCPNCFTNFSSLLQFECAPVIFHYLLTGRIQCEVLTTLPFCFLGLKSFQDNNRKSEIQLSGEITQVTFRKSSTLLVQQLKKKFE